MNTDFDLTRISGLTEAEALRRLRDLAGELVPGIARPANELSATFGGLSLPAGQVQG